MRIYFAPTELKKSMERLFQHSLGRRILTALVLVPPLIAALFYLSTFWIALLFGVFILVGAWEWSALAGLTTPTRRGLYVISLTTFGALAVYALFRDPVSVVPLLGAAVLWWLWVFVELWRHPSPDGGWLATRTGRLVSGFCTLVPAWIAPVFLHAADPSSPSLLLFLFLLVWTADTAAYFFGWAFGRHKLASLISPGKTVEGALAQLVMSVLAALGARATFFPALSLESAVVVGLLLGVVGQVGDLLESAIKRSVGTKDTGRLIPGHGGMLDRVDSLLVNTPVLFYYATYARSLGA